MAVKQEHYPPPKSGKEQHKDEIRKDKRTSNQFVMWLTSKLVMAQSLTALL